MNQRIKEIRTDAKLSMRAFADKIGISSSAVALIETGKNNPSEQTIRAICSEFGVYREWLETGEGLKYKRKPETSIEQEIADIVGMDDPFAVSILSALLKMPPEFWQTWKKELMRVIDEQKKSGE